MFRLTEGYRSRRISNRFETSEPSEFNTPIENERSCSWGTIELVIFNTEYYGRQPVLENLRAGKRQKQIFHNQTSRSHHGAQIGTQYNGGMSLADF